MRKKGFLLLIKKLKDKDNQNLIIKLKWKWDNQFYYILTLIYLYYLVALVTMIINFNIINYYLTYYTLTGVVTIFSAILMPIIILLINDRKRSKELENIIKFLKKREKS